MGLSWPSSIQRIDVVGALALLLGRGVEHGEAEDRAVPRVKGAERKDRLGGAAGHQDHAAALAEQGDGDLEVRLALGLVPDVDALGRELAEPARGCRRSCN